MNILGYELELTCSACPEQYDVFRNNYKVGYLRLRHGHFRAEAHGVVVYEADTRGDGIFDESEREHHLTMAIRAIDAALVSEGQTSIDV